MRPVLSSARMSLLLLSTVPFLYPFLFVAATALKPQLEFDESSIALPHHPTLRNLSDAWTQGKLGSSVVNSLIAVGVASVVTIIISAMGAFWFVNHRGRVATVMRV